MGGNMCDRTKFYRKGVSSSIDHIPTTINNISYINAPSGARGARGGPRGEGRTHLRTAGAGGLKIIQVIRLLSFKYP